ncbi:MAG: FliM/FliN family flagellar motor switch protein [Planctomycetes bacterium]|nr:FliM/FliN family flagellar motor switch protein [Planctomycetota bacterium]
MADVLDQEEVDALLAAVEQGSFFDDHEETSIGSAPVATEHELYDFTQPEILTKAESEALHTLSEFFARDFKSEMSAFLQDEFNVQFQQADVLTYQTLKTAFQSPYSCLNMMTASPLEGQLIVELHPAIVFPVIDKLLGGGKNVDTSVPERELTSIEWRLVGSISERIINVLDRTWKRVAPLKFALVGVESMEHLVCVIPEYEPVVLLSFVLEMGEAQGTMQLCLPYKMFKKVLPRVVQRFGPSPVPLAPGISAPPLEEKKKSVEPNDTLLETIPDVQLEAVVSLGEVMLNVGVLEQLKVGDVIPLHTTAETPLDLKIKGVPKFRVSPAVLHSHAAIKILGAIESKK